MDDPSKSKIRPAEPGEFTVTASNVQPPMIASINSVPQLVLYLPFRQRFQICWALLWHGRAKLPEAKGER